MTPSSVPIPIDLECCMPFCKCDWAIYYMYVQCYTLSINFHSLLWIQQKENIGCVCLSLSVDYFLFCAKTQHTHTHSTDWCHLLNWIYRMRYTIFISFVFSSLTLIRDTIVSLQWNCEDFFFNCTVFIHMCSFTSLHLPTAFSTLSFTSSVLAFFFSLKLKSRFESNVPMLFKTTSGKTQWITC